MSKTTIGVQERVSRILIYAFLILVAAIFLTPFLWLFLGALKTEVEFGSMRVTLFPEEPQWQNFLTVLQRSNVPRGFRNSLLLTAIYLPTVIISSSMAGYAFSRLNVRGKNKLFGLLLATMLLPGIALLIPTFTLFNTIGMTNTFWPWFFWALGTSKILVFLFRQFFSALPKNLEEAATIDGCSYFGIYTRIIMPISSPAIVVGIILSFDNTWSDFLTPFLYLKEQLYPLAVIIQTGLAPPYSATGRADTVITLAATIYLILPMIIGFFFLQKNIVKGITLTGMKG